MATARPFLYNTGAPIPGTIQVGDLAVGTPTSGFTVGEWWNGPDEELGYVIAYIVPDDTQPAPDGRTASVQFWRSSGLIESSFIELAEYLTGQTFMDGNSASSYLTSNGYWNSWSSITPTLTPTITPTLTPTITPTLTPTPTPTSSGDADATAYLNAVVSNGGTVDGTITSAVNNLFSSLKSAGIYNKLVAMYPVIGGVANSHALNAINPITGDTYYLEFFGPWTHSFSGMNTSISSINNRAETGLIPSVAFIGGEYSYGVYVNSDPQVNDEYALGAYVNGTNATAIEFLSSAVKYYLTPSNTSLTSLVTNQGFLQLSIRTTSGDARFSNSIETKTGSFARANSNTPTVEFYLSNLNLNGSPYNSNPVRNCFTYFSNYLTPTELGIFSSIVQDFQTTLSRQI